MKDFIVMDVLLQIAGFTFLEIAMLRSCPQTFMQQLHRVVRLWYSDWRALCEPPTSARRAGDVRSLLILTQVPLSAPFPPPKCSGGTWLPHPRPGKLASQGAATVVFDLLLLLPISPKSCQKITTQGGEGTETVNFMPKTTLQGHCLCNFWLWRNKSISI